MAPSFGEADRLRAELRAREVLGHPRILFSQPLILGGEPRAAVIDLVQQEVLVGNESDRMHIRVPLRHGRDPYEDERYVGGSLWVEETGRVCWEFFSGSYPIDQWFVPNNIRDFLRGMKIHVVT